MKQSWIRRWFMKQDDFALWCFGLVLLLSAINAAFWLVGILLKIVLHFS